MKTSEEELRFIVKLCAIVSVFLASFCLFMLPFRFKGMLGILNPLADHPEKWDFWILLIFLIVSLTLACIYSDLSRRGNFYLAVAGCVTALTVSVVYF